MSRNSARRWQVLVSHDPGAVFVAGLPPAVRAAYRAGAELQPERVVVAGADERFLRRWSPQLRAGGAPVVGDALGAAALDARLPLLALDPGSFPDEGALAAFAAAAPSEGSARRVQHGRTVAALQPRADALGAGARPPREVLEKALREPARDVAAGEFLDARPGGADSSAARLYARLAKDTDGYIAKLDRTLSIAISRALLPFPVTPNHVTTASLVLGLLGAWWLASADGARQFHGALLLWFCCLLDGCDGEIARLKHLQTPWGAAYDVWADHFAHLATFVALPIGVARLHPGRDWTLPGVLLVTGFLACAYSVWRLVLRHPEERRGPAALVVERVASRDYVYLIVALTALGRLDWFVWAAAVGSHAFNAWLWLSARRLEPARTA